MALPASRLAGSIRIVDRVRILSGDFRAIRTPELQYPTAVCALDTQLRYLGRRYRRLTLPSGEGGVPEQRKKSSAGGGAASGFPGESGGRLYTFPNLEKYSHAKLQRSTVLSLVRENRGEGESPYSR